MAVRYAVATGNWSATSTWNGGTLPASGDDIYANGFTVTIDTQVLNIGIGKISTQLCPLTSIAGGSFSYNIVGTAPLTFTGNLYGGTTACLVPIGNGRVITINGNIYGGTVAGAAGLGQNNLYNCTYYLNGDVTAGSVATATAVSFYNNVIYLEVNGNVYGTTAPAFTTPVTNNCVINGNILAQSTGVPISMALNTNGTFRLNGNITGTATNAAVSVTGTSGTVIVNGNEVNKNGFPAVQLQVGTIRKVYGNTWNGTPTVQRENGTDFLLYTATSFNMPITSNVRTGITYGGGAYTGTLSVPPASSVAVGVPVNGTVGTAIISVTDMGALLASYNV